MPAPIDRETKEQIVILRAIDHSKTDIADELDISRHTVSSYLAEIGESIESASNRRKALIRFLDHEKIGPYDEKTSIQSSGDGTHFL